jgi:hypothetical protein
MTETERILETTWSSLFSSVSSTKQQWLPYFLLSDSLLLTIRAAFRLIFVTYPPCVRVFLENLTFIQVIEIFTTTHLGVLYKIQPSDPVLNSKTFMHSEPNILRQIAAIRMGLERDKVVLEYVFLWEPRFSPVNCHYTNLVYIVAYIHVTPTSCGVPKPAQSLLWCGNFSRL